MSEPKETILKRAITTKNTIAPIKIGKGIKATKAPKAQATPFPPLNPRKGDVICPRTVKRAIKAAKSKEKNFKAKKVGKKALLTSNIAVKRPSFLSNLKTFVAPIFPLPNFLISCPLKNLTKINPYGTEPDK